MLRSLIRSIATGRGRNNRDDAASTGAVRASPRGATIEAGGWRRVRPRYDIDSVLSFTQLDDASRPLPFAELALDGVTLRYCISSPASEWRVRTLFTKEPETIDWIHSFQPGDAFVDVGANVGMYSLYACVVAGARVFAFEPESQNYAELCRSIFFNDAGRRNAVAWCAAIGDQPVEVSRLFVRDLRTGDSFHDFGAPSRDYAAADRFAQGSVGFSLDHLVSIGAVPQPDHVKIDVDGHEHKVVSGMRGLLDRRAMRTVLIEADAALPHTRPLIESMLGSGWVVNADQLRFSRDGLRPAKQVMERLRAGAFTGNVIFGRSAEDLAFATRALERYTPAEIDSMALAE
jgi:FkbM family methyltransferase